MSNPMTTAIAPGERVFTDPTVTGLALAAGAILVKFHDTGSKVEFTLQRVPAEFEQRHRAGELQVTTKDAERYIEQVIGLIRGQARMRDRAKMNRDAMLAATPKAVAR